MKRLFKFLIIFPILALSIYVHAQEPYNLDDYKVVGNTVCIVNYSVQVIDDTVNMEHRNTNRFVLECCNNISKFYSYNLYVYDSLYTESINKGKQTYPSPKGICFSEEVVKYFDSNLMSVYYRMPMEDIHEYNETLPEMKWTLLAGTKEIIGYSCQKAECVFRGRHWVAWYTMEIPIADGPWKFCGLPGLVLQIEDVKCHFSFVCTNVQLKEKPVILYDYHYVKSSREEVRNKLVACYSNWWDYCRRTNADGKAYVGKRDANGKITILEVPENEIKVVPYNPIELE